MHVGIVSHRFERYVLVRDTVRYNEYVLADARPELQIGTVIVYQMRFVQGTMWKAYHVARFVTMLRLCVVSLVWAFSITCVYAISMIRA